MPLTECQHGLLSLFSPSDEENSRHVVVNCSEALLKNNTYWPLVSDFINILSHQSVAKKFLEDHSLLMLWMSFVSFFQGNIIFISMWLSPFFLCRKKWRWKQNLAFAVLTQRSEEQFAFKTICCVFVTFSTVNGNFECNTKYFM